MPACFKNFPWYIAWNWAVCQVTPILLIRTGQELETKRHVVWPQVVFKQGQHIPQTKVSSLPWSSRQGVSWARSICTIHYTYSLYKSSRRDWTCKGLGLSASFLPGKIESYTILINGRKTITIYSPALRSTCRGPRMEMTELSGWGKWPLEMLLAEIVAWLTFSYIICPGKYWPGQSAGIKTTNLEIFSQLSF